jgi:lysozyme
MSKLQEQLKRHEGLMLKAYKCTSNRTTIGYGRNLDDKGITQAEADLMLENDVLFLMSVLPAKISFFNELDKARADVLVNMAFNLGVNGLLGFKKMLAAIDDGYFTRAAAEMLDSKWARQVGDRALELAEQMRVGEYK